VIILLVLVLVLVLEITEQKGTPGSTPKAFASGLTDQRSRSRENASVLGLGSSAFAEASADGGMNMDFFFRQFLRL